MIKSILVAPFRGAWIEINIGIVDTTYTLVAPFRGAWIEMLTDLGELEQKESLPLGERGLK